MTSAKPLALTGLLLLPALCGCGQPRDASGGPTATRRPRIAIVLVSDTYLPLSAEGLREGMRELGYRDGVDVEYDVLNAGGDQARLPALIAAELQKDPTVICPSTITAINAVKATRTRTPVVFLESMYPVELGIVQSLTHPGGNYTGVSNMTGPMSGKRLELLKRMCPRIRRVGLFYNPDNQVSRLSFEATRSAAEQLGVQLAARPFTTDGALAAAIEAVGPGDFDAIVLNPDFMVFKRLPEIVALAKAHRLPTMGFDATQVEAGLMASYGGGLKEIARQAARQVDRVLRGESAATIPVEPPRQYRLLVNLATAREIGVALPEEILYQADEYVR
jgi:putative ABC transport system substrate-binding protein